MIYTRNLNFFYPGRKPVFDNLNLTIETGSYTALMGANGSGKTTFAHILKGLITPSGGEIFVDGIAFTDSDSRYEMMKRVGLVFQNPENTMVSTTVESELAFGLENLSVNRNEMHERISEALHKFDLLKHRYSNPSSLSGGEMQRLALASVMIMRPSCLILDEPTSLLDPSNRKNILEIIRKTAEEGTTVIHITHFDFEALHADRLIVFGHGGVISDGNPGTILKEDSAWKKRAYFCSGIDSDQKSGFPGLYDDAGLTGKKNILDLENTGFIYEKGTPFEQTALENINIKFPENSSTVLLGASGSGKTTFLEIAAGVSDPTSGSVTLESGVLRAMTFQFPEHYLFGDTVEKYVAFGPENTGIAREKIKDIVDSALYAVGLDPEEYSLRDPFELSGGEKRRVALAGVLAMNPDILVLDEPTAGLDREGIALFVSHLEEYKKNGGTVLFSTHDFEVACTLARRAIVLENGKIESSGKIDEVFGKSGWLGAVDYRDFGG